MIRVSAATLALAWLVAAPAGAERPTDPGALFSYTPEDQLSFHDVEDAAIRVHYSTAGPSAVSLVDKDGNDVPDFVQEVATFVKESLAVYETELGLRPPVGEAELGLEDLGGSSDLDVYLVDFGGMGDGHFSSDACGGMPVHCAGALIVENDFAGYGYPSPVYGAELVTSHELFHGVQAAYAQSQPVWFSEGTAVWGSAQYGLGGLNDLVGFGSKYVLDSWRTLYKPPGGPVPSFAYGTAIFFDFLTTRHDVSIVADALEVSEMTADNVKIVEGIAAALADRDDTLAEAWTEFVSWNLATGSLAGGSAPSYEYAQYLSGVTAETDDTLIDDEGRFYPLSGRYYRMTFDGGLLWFGLEAEAPGVFFSVFPESAGGALQAAIDTWEGTEAVSRAIGGGAEQAAGVYWLAVANTLADGNSTKVRVCLGDEELATACSPVVVVPPDSSPPPEPAPSEDTGTAEPLDAGSTQPDTGGGADAGGDVGSTTPAPADDDEGGCSAGRGSSRVPLALVGLALLFLGLIGRRERPAG